MRDQEQPNELEKLTLERGWLQEAIDFEYHLNDGRLNALLVFNAILFGVFGVVLSKDGMPIESFRWILVGIPILGASISMLSRRAIGAGISQIEKLKKRRSSVFEKLRPLVGIELIGAAVGDPNHWAGLLPARWFPIFVTASWMLALTWVLLSRFL